MKKLMMIAAVMIASSALADTEIVDGIEWHYFIENGTATVGQSDAERMLTMTSFAAIPENTAGKITVPNSLGGYSVSCIGSGAFHNCNKLTGVTIPKGITKIDQAFGCCDNLKSVTIPEGVEWVKRPFFQCDSLVSVSLPASLRTIVGCLVYDCDKIEEITIPANLEVIEDLIEESGGYSYSLVERTIASRGDNLRKITVNSANKHFVVKDGTLYTKDLSELLTCPDQQEILNIPASVKYYSAEGILGKGLKKIIVDSKNTTYSSVDGMLCDKNGETLLRCPRGRAVINIPAGIKAIDGLAIGGSRVQTIIFHGMPPELPYPEFCLEGSQGYYTSYKSEWEKVIVNGKWGGLPMQYKSDAGSTDEEKDDDERDGQLIEGGFSGEKAMMFNGLVKDADGALCGIAQIATAKATSKGVKVSGSVMLSDGKKQTLKAVAVPIENGQLNVETKIGKTEVSLMITGDGFTGTFGDLSLASADVGEDTGILSGTLKMSYFDAKTGKIKTKSIKLTGVASEGEAVGELTVKGEETKTFSAEVE